MKRIIILFTTIIVTFMFCIPSYAEELKELAPDEEVIFVEPPCELWRPDVYCYLTISGTYLHMPINLYCGYEYEHQIMQAITDLLDQGIAIDYSWYYIEEVSLIFADHKHQEFSALYDVIPDVTTARTNFPDGTSKKYICCESSRGINNGKNIQNSSGYPVETAYPSDWIVMYTCLENWQNILYTVWRPE